jgi:cell division protease FtsH
VKFDLDLIHAKQRKLEEVKTTLKGEFFGLDTIIDRAVDSVSAWYVFPELITRPVIICLWGMTGVGKTQLVRRIVQCLDLTRIFVEITMDGTSGGSWDNKISDHLGNSMIEEGQPGILLLDEIQRFRTVDEQAGDAEVKRFSDVWALLSDGKLPVGSSAFEDVVTLVYGLQNSGNVDPDDDVEPESAASKKKRRKKAVEKPLSYWEAKRIKNVLRAPESIEDIMKWPKSEIILKAGVMSQSQEEYDFTKLLIFVSGNLDEAFEEARRTNDCDTDADIFHEMTLKITTPDIKAALVRRFRPEQISRFGNNHIIYPSLSKDSYRKLICSTCAKYTKTMEELSDIKFDIDPSLYEEIYQNSVFPTQGTRPVFSSIHKIYASALTHLVIWAVENQFEHLQISIDAENKLIIGRPIRTLINKILGIEEIVGTESKSVPIELDLRDVRNKIPEEFFTLVGVHESGHAMVYIDLFGAAPTELNISVASWQGGYISAKPSQVAILTKEEILNLMAVKMAGTAAEELVFGDVHRSNGCVMDIIGATELADEYVRRTGFDQFDCVLSEGNERHNFFNEISRADDIVNKLVRDAKAKALKALTSNQKDFTALVQAALDQKRLSQDDMVALFPERNLAMEPPMTQYREFWKRYTQPQ